MDTDRHRIPTKQLRRETAEAAPAMTAEEQIDHALTRRPRNILTLLLRYLLPLALTIALLWYMFRQVDFANMMKILREGVDYWWILLAMGISVLSHVCRAARWRLQLNALQITPPFMALCCSIFGCYALNLVFPRLGEVWRCTYIAKKGKAPFTTVLGSMVSDRLTDTLTVIALLGLTFIVAGGAISRFLHKYPVGQDLMDLAGNPFFWAAVIVALTIVGLFFYLGRSTKVVKKLVGWLKEVWIGFATLWHIKGRLRFALLTVAIWACFFVQLYVAFFAFDFTRELCRQPGTTAGLVPCLVAFVISAVGMAVPSNGGLGPWNVAIMFGLSIYGIPETEGSTFSMVQWTGQTIMLIILGIFTMAYIAKTHK